MSSFSLDEGAAMFQSDISSLLPQLEEGTQAFLERAAQRTEGDTEEQVFGTLEFVGHSLRGIARTVAANSVAEVGEVVEALAAEGRRAMLAAQAAAARARTYVELIATAQAQIPDIVAEELGGDPEAALSRARAWQLSFPAEVQRLLQGANEGAEEHETNAIGNGDAGAVHGHFELAPQQDPGESAGWGSLAFETEPPLLLDALGGSPDQTREVRIDPSVHSLLAEGPGAGEFGPEETGGFRLEASLVDEPAAHAPEEIDEELREVFREEAGELAQPIREAFAGLSSDARGAAAELDRLFHTMKGAAASVGLERVAAICKELEDTFEHIAEGRRELDPQLGAHLRGQARAAFASAGIDFGLATETLMKVPAPAGFELEPAEDEVDEMAEAFRLEMRDLATAIRDSLLRVARGAGEDALTRLERSYHTIRGAASTVGYDDTAALAQRLQERAEQALDGDIEVNESFLQVTLAETNELFRMVKLAPVELGSVGVEADVEADFQAEAREILDGVMGSVELAFGRHAPETKQSNRARLAGLLHRLGGAAAMNQRMPVSDEALQLERDLISGSITGRTFVAGLERISKDLQIELPAFSGVATDDKDEEPIRLEKEPVRSSGPVREQVDIMAEPEVFEAFVEECAELLDAIDNEILVLQETAEPRQTIQELSRLVHTLKGSVNTVGLRPTGKLLHRVEDALESITGRTVLPSGRVLARLLLGMQDEVRRNLRTAPKGYVETNYAALDREVEDLLGSGQRAPGRAAAADESAAQIDMQREVDTRTIRVNSERIDSLMTLAGEMVLSRSRLLSRVQRLRSMQRDLHGSRSRLLSVVDNFVERYEFNLMGNGGQRKFVVEESGRVPVLSLVQDNGLVDPEINQGFSDLELDRYEDINILARSLAEVSSDINEAHQLLFSELGHFVEDSDSFSSLVSTLQREVTNTRMVPMESLYTRARLLLIDAAEREQKEVRTELTGRSVPLDKSILDALYTPLLHIVRNAVTHGIEAPEERLALGKPRVGVVSISARQEAGRVVIDVRDDGRGLDLVRLKQKGVALGLISPDTPEDDPAVAGLVFAAGVSTRETASSAAGRGIGGDAVKAAIESLNGSIAVSTRHGEGTTYHIVLPLTLAIMRALVVKSAKYNYALPLYMTEHILQANEAQLIESSGVKRLMFEERAILAVSLGDLLEMPADNPQGPYVITRVGESRLAVQVDAVLRQEEIFVRSLGTILSGHPLFAGVTVSGAGEAEMIIDVNGLIAAAGVSTAADRSIATSAAQPARAVQRRKEQRRRRALVVDDSLSVRKVAEKFLKGLGVEVVLAVDGVDALEKLRVEQVDIVFTDLEMPRMHGYELIREIRFIPAFAELPIAVVTSRSSQKHRDHARSLGANDYVTKPFTQERFAAILQEWLGGDEKRVGAP